jgi:recombination protein RecR
MTNSRHLKNMQKNLIENLSKIIAKLPGMGPRIAKRIVLYLANNKARILLPLIENLQALYDKIHHCETCGNLDEGKICAICLSETRDKNLICIVEEVADLFAIERAENYRGKYHVLGGNLSALSGKTIEDLNLEKLYSRLREGKIAEVIIATSATLDGQTTAHFLAENLKEFAVKVTRLTHGIPVGSELDYLDEGTISIAFKTRSEF